MILKNPRIEKYNKIQKYKQTHKTLRLYSWMRLTRIQKKCTYNHNNKIIPQYDMSPDRTVQMAANALIFRAYILLFMQSNSNSTNIIRNPKASRVMYVNSENKASQRTPVDIQNKTWHRSSRNYCLCHGCFTLMSYFVYFSYTTPCSHTIRHVVVYVCWFLEISWTTSRNPN